LQPLVFYFYVKKHFKIDKKVPKDQDAIKQRWSGFGHTFAYFINANSGVMLLTFFSTLSLVSVYSVHLMISNALRNLAVAIASAILPSLGSVMSKGNGEESNRAFDLYEFGMSFMTVLLFTCGIILIVPFVRVYTAGVTDANYIQPIFAFVLMLAEMIYCLREPYINVAYAAGHFKQTVKYAYIEVAINIGVSLMLVKQYNLLGVALGFLCALIFRFVAHIIYLKKNILMRPIQKSIKMMACFFAVTSISFVCANWILPLDQIQSYVQWFLYAIVVFIFVLVMLLLASWLVYKEELMRIIGRKRIQR